jgi:hypothetical protein
MYRRNFLRTFLCSPLLTQSREGNTRDGDSAFDQGEKSLRLQQRGRVSIAIPPGSSPLEQFAAAELRKYLGRIFSLPVSATERERGGRTQPADFYLGSGEAVREILSLDMREKFSALPPDGYLFSLQLEKNRPTLVIAGKGEVGVLYGVYDLLERYGMRFFLSGDIFPAGKPRFEILKLCEAVAPKIPLRGSLPWFNFMMGPTGWNVDDFKSYVDQLAKLRYNFLNFHFYSHDPFLSFIYKGVRYPTDYQAYSSGHPAVWPVSSLPVGREHFKGEYFGMPGGANTKIAIPRLQQTLDFAKARGFKTAVGIEVAAVPVLVSFIPQEDFVGEKPASTTDALQQALYNLDPTSDSAEDITRARLKALVETYPNSDFYTLWYSELGPYQDVTPDKMSPKLRRFYEEKVRSFEYEQWHFKAPGYVILVCWIELAYRILKQLKPDARLVICGWSIDSMLPGADGTLPKDIIFSSLSGYEPQWALNAGVVNRFWETIRGREKHYVTWWEYDGRCLGMLQPKIRAYDRLFRQVAENNFDAMVFLHWRTRILDENARYTALRCWDEKLTPEAYYEDYARSKFGIEAAPKVREALLALEDYEEWQLAEEGTYLSSIAFDFDTLPSLIYKFTKLVGLDFSAQGRLEGDPVETVVSRLRSGKDRQLQGNAEEALAASKGSHNLQEAILRLTRTHGALKSAQLLCKGEEHRRNLGYLMARVEYYIEYLKFHGSLLKAFMALTSDGVESFEQRVEKAKSLLTSADATRVVTKYAEYVTNPGEKGVLVSLNRKLIDPVKAISGRLEQIVDLF